MNDLAVYQEMRDSGVSWIGNIPTHWPIVRAKYYFQQTNNRGNDEAVLLAASQKYGVCPQSWLEGVVKVADGTDLQMFKTVHKGDFVISLRSFQGGFERSDFEGVCSPAYQVFHATKDFDSNYLKYLFKNELFIDYMNSLTVGIREGRNIKYEDFSNSLIFVPPLEEQQAIVDYLDDACSQINSVISEAKASIEEYKKWGSAIIYEAVTKGLDPNVEMKDSGVRWGSKIPKNWLVEKAKFHFTQTNGRGNEILELLAASQQYGVCPQSWLEGVVKVADGTDLSQFKTVHKGDFVISLRSFQGGFELSGFEGVCSPAYQVFHADCQFETGYLKYLFKNKMFIDEMNSLTVGIREGKNIKYSDFANSFIIIPPVEEQRNISDYLDRQCMLISTLISEKESLITDLEAYKKSLIYEIVTGKRRAL